MSEAQELPFYNFLPLAPAEEWPIEQLNDSFRQIDDSIRWLFERSPSGGGGTGAGYGLITSTAEPNLLADVFGDELVINAGVGIDIALNPGSPDEVVITNLLPSLGWHTFIPQPANPGGANTLWQEDGSAFDPNTLIWGDLSQPSLFGGNFSIGDPGFEQGGLDVNGVLFGATSKINDFGGTVDAMLVLHRHSTSFGSNLVFSRSNSDDSTHAALTAGQVISQIVNLGWSGSHYDIAAFINTTVPLGTTVSPTSLAGQIEFYTTPDLSNTSLLALIIGSDQVIYGGDLITDDLTLAANQVNTGAGRINVNTPIVFGPYSGITGAQYGFSYTAVENFLTNFVGGGLNFSGNITFSNSTFIYESFRGAPTITSNATPGFAAYTVMQSLPVMIAGNGAAEHPLQALVINAGVQIRNPFSGVRTVPAVAAINFASTLNPSVNGATLTCNSWTGMTLQPNWNTVAGSIANFGDIRGLWARNPGQALFGSSAGVERLESYIGLEVDNITLNNAGGNAVRAAVRSAMLDGTNKFFLVNNGTANSLFANSDAIFYDAGAVVFGTGLDVRIEWDNAAGAWNWNPLVGEDLGIVFGVISGKPSYLFEAENFGVSEVNYTQIRYGFDRFAFGQTGTIGNQVGIYVAGPRTVEVAGGWADFLLTQGGSLNIGTFAMSDVSAWVINQISLDNTAGSIVSLDTFVVGGMTTSNPGITVTERSALRVSGRSKLRGSIQFPPIDPSALSAGNNNDWAGLLTGSPNNNGRYWARVTGNAAGSDITGIDATAVQDGDTYEITNVGTDIIRLMHEDTASVAANRIINVDGNNFTLKPNGTATVRYDATTARFRVTTQPGAVAPLAGNWRFDTSTVMADPGSGEFRNNNATVASITSIAINDISFKGGDVSNILSNIASGDQLYVQNISDGAEFYVFDITGVTDNTTWWQIDGTINSSGAAFSANNEFGIVFIFA